MPCLCVPVEFKERAELLMNVEMAESTCKSKSTPLRMLVVVISSYTMMLLKARNNTSSFQSVAMTRGNMTFMIMDLYA